MEALRGRNRFDGAPRSGQAAAQELSEYLEASGAARHRNEIRVRNAGRSNELLRNPATRIARPRLSLVVPRCRGNRKRRNAKPWNAGRQYCERLPRSRFTPGVARV